MAIHTYTRRELLKLGAGITATLGGRSGAAHAAPKTIANTIVINGRIATGHDKKAFASAAAIKDGRFLAVGSDAEVMTHKRRDSGD
jgi:hypothetical protein